MDEHFYTIEVVSRRADVSPAVVRRYTRLGFVTPRSWRKRTPLYDDAELARLRKIVRLTRDLGLNLAGVEVVLRLTDEIAALRRALAAQQKED
jgi:MerR family transcriptional regulator/heat shock protein HspR